jgi:hypothetical protein
MRIAERPLVIQNPDEDRAVEVPQKGLKNCLVGVLLSKERPAVDAWNCSIFGGPLFCPKLLRQPDAMEPGF